jgi:signal transduction histidine kinase
MRASRKLAGSRARHRLVHREAERAARVVTNLLRLRARDVCARRISLNGVVTRTPPRVGAEGRVHRRDARSRQPSPRVNADPILLQRAILNVVMNAEQAIGATDICRSPHASTRPPDAPRLSSNGPGPPTTSARVCSSRSSR